MNPGFLPPIGATGSPAVAGRDAAIEWQCDPKSNDTMCQFWVVQGMTRKQLNANANGEYHARVGVRLRFNCKLLPHVMTCVNIGIAILGQGPLTMTRALEVPSLVNAIDLDDGEQLFLEIPEAAHKPVTKRDWKQAHHESEAHKPSKGTAGQGRSQGQGRRRSGAVVTKRSRAHHRAAAPLMMQPQSWQCDGTTAVAEMGGHSRSRGGAPTPHQARR